ncbi:MAG TPA: PaaI family thioesterase [Alphaproteobacteria bacterium]|jgi:uncharacterized protein (TIGR00369 family)
MNDLLSLGRQALSSQPFSRMVGAELEIFREGLAELRLPLRQELKQQHGFAHGGDARPRAALPAKSRKLRDLAVRTAQRFVADNALTFAGGSVLGTAVVTSEFKINYVRPALGTALIARATVVHAGKSQAVCRCDVFALKDGVEILAAVAQGTIARMGGGPEEG